MDVPQWLIDDTDEFEESEYNSDSDQYINGYKILRSESEYFVIRYNDTDFLLSIKSNANGSFTTSITSGSYIEDTNQFYVEQYLFTSYEVYVCDEDKLTYFSSFVAKCLSINLFDLDDISEQFLGHFADGSVSVPNIDYSKLN